MGRSVQGIVNNCINRVGGWGLEAGGWRLGAGGWRLEAGGWGLEAVKL
jgi:hypothetical protein